MIIIYLLESFDRKHLLEMTLIHIHSNDKTINQCDGHQVHGVVFGCEKMVSLIKFLRT